MPCSRLRHNLKQSIYMNFPGQKFCVHISFPPYMLQVLRRLFRPKRGEVTLVWRKLRNEFHNLQFLCNVMLIKKDFLITVTVHWLTQNLYKLNKYSFPSISFFAFYS